MHLRARRQRRSFRVQAVAMLALLLGLRELAFGVEPANAPIPNITSRSRVLEWLQSPDESKRMAGINRVHWGSGQDDEYAQALSKLLEASTTRRQTVPSTWAAITLLETCPLPSADEALSRQLAADDWRTQMMAAEALGKRGSAGQYSKAITDCWRGTAARENYALRHSLLDALGQSCDSAGLDALVRLLPETEGQLKFESVAQLTQRTGLTHGDDAEAWAAWSATRSTSTAILPALPAEKPEKIPWKQPVPEFFEIPIYAKRVLFVIDVSNSMRSTLDGKTRLETMQEQLTTVVKGLSEDTDFDMIFFQDRVQPWRAELVPATSANKSAAIQVIWKKLAANKTAANDALETALDYSEKKKDRGYLELIVFLTDGRPTAGRITAPHQIVENLVLKNRLKKTRIDTVGLDSNGESEQFLTELATRNYGKYHKLR